MAKRPGTEVAEPETNGSSTTTGSSNYMTPILHISLPGRLVDAGFWGGLVGAVALGVVDPPVGVLVGTGVVVARHQIRKSEAV
jgi:hypothetical protein